MSRLYARSEPQGQRPGLSTYGGVVAGMLTTYAEYFEVDPMAIVSALAHESVEPLTEVRHEQPRQYHISFDRKNFRALAEQIEKYR